MKNIYPYLLSCVFLISCISNGKNFLDGIWEPKIINQTGMDVREQIEIKGDSLTFRAILPDSTLETTTLVSIIDSVSHVYEVCFDNSTELLQNEACFRFRQIDQNVIEVWNTRNADIVVTYLKLKR